MALDSFLSIFMDIPSNFMIPLIVQETFLYPLLIAVFHDKREKTRVIFSLAKPPRTLVLHISINLLNAHSIYANKHTTFQTLKSKILSSLSLPCGRLSLFQNVIMRVKCTNLIHTSTYTSHKTYYVSGPNCYLCNFPEWEVPKNRKSF